MSKRHINTAWKKRLSEWSRKLHLVFVPHKKNQYRPHLTRRYGLLVILGLVVGLQFGYNYTQTGNVLGRVTTVTPAGLLASTNEVRASHGVEQLKLNSQLNEAAAHKADDIMQRQYWSHVSPDGVEPWQWIEQVGYVYNEAGENLAKNFHSSGATVVAWMDSPSHRENVLKETYRDVGFAIRHGLLNDKPATVIVALYATPTQSTVAGANTTIPSVSEVQNVTLTPAARIGIAIQSLTPAAVTSIALLFIAATVAVTAHIYRRQLPKKLRQSWYRHHGVAKATGLLSVMAFIVLIYGGGQI